MDISIAYKELNNKQNNYPSTRIAVLNMYSRYPWIYISQTTILDFRQLHISVSRK